MVRLFGPKPANDSDNTGHVQHRLLIIPLTAQSQLHVAGIDD